MLSSRDTKEAHRCHRRSRHALRRLDHLGEDGSGGRGTRVQLRELFDGPRLSPGQRRIAQYLIEHITEAAFLSITDLAERVGVSQPSVTRFAAAVGFSGLPRTAGETAGHRAQHTLQHPGHTRGGPRQRAAVGGGRRDREPGEPAPRLRRSGPGDRHRPRAVAVDPAHRSRPAHLGVAGRVLPPRRPPHPPRCATGDARRERRLRRAAPVARGGRHLAARLGNTGTPRRR